MYDNDAPEWQLLADTKPVARKWYACQACPHPGRGSAMIPPGQRYRKIVGLEDGALVTRAAIAKATGASQ